MKTKYEKPSISGLFGDNSNILNNENLEPHDPDPTDPPTGASDVWVDPDDPNA